jgi:hypothetical protein
MPCAWSAATGVDLEPVLQTGDELGELEIHVFIAILGEETRADSSRFEALRWRIALAVGLEDVDVASL